MQWKDSVVVITGASRGIGRELARALAARGARVGLLARSKAELDEVLAACGGNGATAVCDVADRASVEAAIETLRRELGPVDALVNNAGFEVYSTVADTPVEDLERMLRVNYLGIVYATKAVLPEMITRARGHIVNVGSVAGRLSVPFETGYCASKFAVAGLTESLSVELAPKGIRMSLVNPGPVATDFFNARGVPYTRSFPKPVPPGDIVNAIIRAVERNLAEVYVPSWLRAAVAFRALLPGVFRSSVAREFRKTLS